MDERLIAYVLEHYEQMLNGNAELINRLPLGTSRRYIRSIEYHPYRKRCVAPNGRDMSEAIMECDTPHIASRLGLPSRSRINIYKTALDDENPYDFLSSLSHEEHHTRLRRETPRKYGLTWFDEHRLDRLVSFSDFIDIRQLLTAAEEREVYAEQLRTMPQEASEWFNEDTDTNLQHYTERCHELLGELMPSKNAMAFLREREGLRWLLK